MSSPEGKSSESGDCPALHSGHILDEPPRPRADLAAFDEALAGLSAHRPLPEILADILRSAAKALSAPHGFLSLTLDQAAERPYGHPDLGSHYHGQVDATESRYEGGPAQPAGSRPGRGV